MSLSYLTFFICKCMLTYLCWIGLLRLEDLGDADLYNLRISEHNDNLISQRASNCCCNLSNSAVTVLVVAQELVALERNLKS